MYGRAYQETRLLLKFTGEDNLVEEVDIRPSIQYSWNDVELNFFVHQIIFAEDMEYCGALYTWPFKVNYLKRLYRHDLSGHM